MSNIPSDAAVTAVVDAAVHRIVAAVRDGAALVRQPHILTALASSPSSAGLLAELDAAADQVAAVYRLVERVTGTVAAVDAAGDRAGRVALARAVLRGRSATTAAETLDAIDDAVAAMEAMADGRGASPPAGDSGESGETVPGHLAYETTLHQ